MTEYIRNAYIDSVVIPVDVVFHPSWWCRHAGITFDEDFFFHPLKRVEVEKKMEHTLYERFGQFGLGADKDLEIPLIGAVHNASGYILSGMLGCEIVYQEDNAPQVISVGMDKLAVNVDYAFKSPLFKRFIGLRDNLKAKYGYIAGDINWSGVLNIALDMAKENILIDFFAQPEPLKQEFGKIAGMIERFVTGFSTETGTSSISVNRNVRHIKQPVFLHSECSHTMIDTEQYDEFLLPIDIDWSKKFRPFGIHYCGNDPHRYAKSFSKIRNLDFLDVGWGGNVKELRACLPNTFLNIRLDPVTINSNSDEKLEKIITGLVDDSGNPYLTGICCINMDDKVEDSKIHTIFNTVKELRTKLKNHS